MNLFKFKGNLEERLGMAWWLMAVWTALMAASLYWNLHQARHTALKLACAEAHLAYNKDLSYRLWAAEHGGVYVIVTPQTPPNPHLSFFKDRDIKTPSGRTLTLVNPAYMTRQVQELAGRLYGARGHLTSLKPIRPENSPDPWEKKALEAFAAGTKNEMQGVVTVAGEPHWRLMRPWRTEKACLKCHASQGYKEGDIRGGLSVDVPLKPYFASFRAQTLPLSAGHGLIWILGLTGILLRKRHIRRGLNERQRSADILKESETRLAEAQRIARLGNWEWDIARNKLTLSDEAYRIFGLLPQEFQMTYEDFLSFIHPDDLMAVKHYLEEGMRFGKYGSRDYRIIRRDGSIRSIYAHGETYLNQEGQPLRMRGTLQDITELKQATESLRESEELVRQAFENANIGMALVGIDGRYLRVNHSMSEMFGYSRAELEKMAVSDFLYPADLHVSKDFRSQSLSGKISSAKFEIRKIHRNGTIVWIHVASTLMRDSQGKPLYFVSHVQDITARKRAEEGLRRAHEELEQRVKERTEELRLTVTQLQEEATERQKAGEALRESEQRLRHLASQILTAQEKERKRVAMELHEGLGQSMSALKMYLRTIQQHLPGDGGRVKQEFEEVQNLLIEMIEEARRLSQGLSPVLLENLGLTAALKHLLDELSKYQEVSITANIDDIRNLFSPQTEINLFRVFQESLHNIAKHAQATQVSVIIKRQNGRVNFLIKDNGVGFDPQQIPAKEIAGRGMGLAAMKERLGMIGAHLNIASRMGEGTEISFSIQCDAQ